MIKLVHFKYEKVGTFCFICGLMGHNEIFFPQLFDKEEDGTRGGPGVEL